MVKTMEMKAQVVKFNKTLYDRCCGCSGINYSFTYKMLFVAIFITQNFYFVYYFCNFLCYYDLSLEQRKIDFKIMTASSLYLQL